MEKEGCPQGTRPLPATPCRRLLGDFNDPFSLIASCCRLEGQTLGFCSGTTPPALETRSWALSCVSAL